MTENLVPEFYKKQKFPYNGVYELQNANFSKVLSGLEEANLDGKYILSGLINLHVHLAGSGELKKKQSDPVKLVKLITLNAEMK